MLNNVCIMGRLTQMPEARAVNDGKVVCRFCVAIPRNYINRSTEEREADFIDVVAWHGLAEFVSSHFDKGDPIVVEGELRSRLWTDKHGVKRKSVSILAGNIFFGAPKKATVPVSGFDPDNDDELPETSECAGTNAPEDGEL